MLRVAVFLMPESRSKKSTHRRLHAGDRVFKPSKVIALVKKIPSLYQIFGKSVLCGGKVCRAVKEWYLYRWLV